jgi:hypothetical protein
MGEFVPPSFAVPFLPTSDIGKIIVLVSIKDGRSIEIKYIKE